MTEIRLLVLDRFEGESAVLLDESDQSMIIPRTLLPTQATEGDYLHITLRDAQVLEAVIDHEAREKAARRIEDKLDRLRRGDHLK